MRNGSVGIELPWPVVKALTYGRKWSDFARTVGLFSGTVALARMIMRRSGTIRVRCPGTAHHLQLRANSADLDSYVKVFVEGEYDLDVGMEPRTILDAGAHIGCSVAYFAARWPNARIVAVEPIEENLALLKENVDMLSNVTVVQAALWHKPGRVNFANPHGRTDSHMAKSAVNESGGVPAVTVQELMDELPERRFELVKIDIEGAERELFGNNAAWLDNVEALLIELHDRMVPGCLDALNKALEPYDFDLARKGENTLIRNLRRKPLPTIAPAG